MEALLYMEAMNEWQKFTETGKISDYLTYINAVGDASADNEKSSNVNDRRHSNKREERW